MSVLIIQRLTSPEPAIRLVEWRCACGRLLAKLALGPHSVVEIKCDKCGRVVERRAA